MERAFGRRAHGTGSVVRNGAGFRWQLNRTGQYYKGPTVPTRQQAIDDLDDAVAALGRGARQPVVAKKQENGGRTRAKTIPPKALLQATAAPSEEGAIEYPADIDRARPGEATASRARSARSGGMPGPRPTTAIP